jgi:hypothetical protein
MTSKIVDFSNLKGDFIGGLVAGWSPYPRPCFGVQSGMGRQQVYMERNHGRDLCSDIWWNTLSLVALLDQ